jgi:hypothetical protein
MEQLNMVTKDGFVRFTVDDALLDQISDSEKAKIGKPQMSYNAEKGEVRVKHTLFLEYQDTSKVQGKGACVNDKAAWETEQKMVPSVNDIVLIPMDFSIVAKVGLAENQPRSAFQTYKSELVKPLMKFRPC